MSNNGKKITARFIKSRLDIFSNNVAHKAPSNVAHKAPSNVAHKAPSNVAHKAPSNVAHKAPSNVAHKAPSNGSNSSVYRQFSGSTILEQLSQSPHLNL